MRRVSATTRDLDGLPCVTLRLLKGNRAGLDIEQVRNRPSLPISFLAILPGICDAQKAMRRELDDMPDFVAMNDDVQIKLREERGLISHRLGGGAERDDRSLLNCHLVAGEPLAA